MSAPELITVYNTCGISGMEKPVDYIRRIFSLTEQRDVNQRIVWASCRNKPEERKLVMDFFGNKISYYFTDDLLTVNQSFNHACMKAEEHFGMPQGFLYVDAGNQFGDDHLAVRRLFEQHFLAAAVMTSAVATTDMGFDLWFSGKTESDIFQGQSLWTVPTGKGVNLHVQIFDEDIVRRFGRVLPDIMASHSTESCFTFLAAALAGFWYVCRDVRPIHEVTPDSGSAGFREGAGWNHVLPASRRKMDDIVTDPEAKLSGFGYEECQGILMHDERLYENGVVKDPERLARFMAENLYLPAETYDRIRCEFIP